jgi:hypothetical protein
LSVLASQNLKRELQRWKQIIKNVLGQGPYATLEKIVVRELAKESKLDA